MKRLRRLAEPAIIVILIAFAPIPVTRMCAIDVYGRASSRLCSFAETYDWLASGATWGFWAFVISAILLLLVVHIWHSRAQE